MKKMIAIAAVVVLLASPAWAIERTSEIVFETFERIDERLGEFEAESATLDEKIKQARVEAKSAIAHIRQAEARGNEVAVEEMRAELLRALAQELAAQQQKVQSAREVYLANRQDLDRLLPHLRSRGFGRTREGKQTLDRLISTSQRFGTDVKGMLLYFSSLEKAVDDPRLRSKIASATGSLQALSRSLELLKARQQAMQAGDFYQVAETVAAYIDALDSALAQLAMAGELLSEQEDKLRLANRLSTLRLITLRVNGTPLSPNKPNLLIDGIIRDVERMDTEAGRYLYPEMDAGGDGEFDPGTALEETGF